MLVVDSLTSKSCTFVSCEDKVGFDASERRVVSRRSPGTCAQGRTFGRLHLPAETTLPARLLAGIALPRKARVQVVYRVRLWVHGARPPARPSCPHALCAELRRLASSTAAPCVPRGVRDSASLPQFSQRARVQSGDPRGNTLRGRPFHHLSWPATPFFATCTPTTHTVKLTPLTPAILTPCAGVNKMHTRCPSTPTPRC